MKQPFLSPAPALPAIREAMAKAAERKQKGLPVFDFSSGNVGALALNQLFFSKLEIRANKDLPFELRGLSEGLKEGITDSYQPKPQGLAYSPTGGTEPLKQLIIQYFQEVHGVPLSEVETDKVIATAGGQQAMTAALRSLKPGTRVFLSRWEYAPLPAIIRGHNLVETRIEVNEDLSLNIGDFRKKGVRNSVFYISMPNNPTGYFAPEDLKKILEVLSTEDGAVIWDAPYIFTVLKITGTRAVFDKAFLEDKITELRGITKKYYKHMCILSSLSKTCLIAGLRFGFATASRKWIVNMNALIGRENLSSPTTSFIAGAAILRKFLETPITHEWLCKVLANRLTILIEEIPEYLMLPRNGMFGALYAMIKTKQKASKAATELLKKQGIVTVAGTQFYGDSVKAVRISLVSIPWSEGDEAWVQSVLALKKALAS